jgi:hypothetical protein
MTVSQLSPLSRREPRPGAQKSVSEFGRRGNPQDRVHCSARGASMVDSVFTASQLLGTNIVMVRQ